MILIFLWHIPSALIPILTIPITVLIAFVPMKAIGVTSNIMSLGGIAIAIGAMVDAAIVVVEQTHKKLEMWEAEGRKRDYHEVVIEAIKEVAPASFFSLLVIAVSFMPIFALEAQEGRLFKPLAFTKNFSMAIAAVLAITLDPAMRLLFTHATEFDFRPRFLARIVNAVLVGKIHPEEKHPISRVLIKLYRPVVEMAVRLRWVVIGGAIAAVVLTVPVFQRLGSEFMPPLNEGTLLYMPTTLPGISLDGSAAAAGNPGSHPEDLSGSRARIRQGRARGDLHGPRAAFHGGDHGAPEAAGPMAEEAAVVLRARPGVVAEDFAPHLARPHFAGRPGG